MIKTEVFEATEDYPYTSIYYRDSDDVAKVNLLLDKEGRLVSKDISEYDCNGKIVCSVRYGRDHHTILGFREYDYDDNQREIGYQDYHVINEENKFLVRTRTVWIIKDKLAHCYYYLENDKPFVYEVFEHNDECGMVTEGRYDMNGNEVTLHPDFKIPVYNMGNSDMS